MTQDFIGAGWAFPLGVGPQGGIALVRREVELEQAMRLILSTYPGERPMRPEFGSRIRDFVFRSVNVDTIAELSQEVRNALLRWEPRVDIEAVLVIPDPNDQGALYIDIQYVV
jgi:phage baseplate assembly protein W